MRRPLLLACLPLLGGCIPYAAPSLDYTPRVKLEVPREGVRAFRVDIASSQYKPLRSAPLVPTRDTVRLSEVPISCRDEVPGQLKASVQYGIVALGPLNFMTRESDSVALRLYRPGYELVEIASWEGTNRVEWKRADPSAQVHAVDALFGGSPEAGSVSKAHREALLFGASEYERLAKLPSPIVWLPEDLEKKARALRELAAK